ncbi:MAG: hypothetical protein ACE5OZ_14140 [Candidatus Heimdallarchaeota archaeon]
MKVIYREYEAEQGLEEIQAKIYNHATRNFGKPLVKAEQIRQRYTKESADPKGIRYALKDDGTPLSYVQTRIKKKKTWIGYPWTMSNCPPEVQEQLWDEVFEYVKNRDLATNSEQTFYMGYLRETMEKQLIFAERKGFKITDRLESYVLDVNKGIKGANILYESRIANESDLDALIELSQIDPALQHVFRSKDKRVAYFKDRIADGHTTLLFNQDRQLIAAGAPIQTSCSGPGMGMRFSGVIPGFEDAWKTLLIEISKHCVDMGWTEDPLMFYSVRNENKTEILREIGAELLFADILYSKTLKRV